jgi:hypothetical protein
VTVPLRTFRTTRAATAFLAALVAHTSQALDRPETTFQIFQFPAAQIPRIDGNADDWAVVPDSYVVGMDQMIDSDKKHAAPNPKNLDVRVRVGWVKGMNRLYFFYEAYDDYWDFSRLSHRNDTFEVMVDGDASGGPLVDRSMPRLWGPESVGEYRSKPDERLGGTVERWAIHGVHAQNYHIFTPAVDKDWAMVWGVATWIKNLPYANAATQFNFKPGESGKLVLEFWITPFDHAAPEGPARAVESVLTENKIIGLGWIVIDYDDVSKVSNNGFWTLSRHRSSFGDASLLPAFRLMPLEPQLRKPIEAAWSFTVVDAERRVVAFRDESQGNITAWKWDFGDGNTSDAQHPIHTYQKSGAFTVVLEIAGPDGRSRRAKVWDVQVK